MSDDDVSDDDAIKIEVDASHLMKAVRRAQSQAHLAELLNSATATKTLFHRAVATGMSVVQLKKRIMESQAERIRAERKAEFKAKKQIDRGLDNMKRRIEEGDVKTTAVLKQIAEEKYHGDLEQAKNYLLRTTKHMATERQQRRQSDAEGDDGHQSDGSQSGRRRHRRVNSWSKEERAPNIFTDDEDGGFSSDASQSSTGSQRSTSRRRRGRRRGTKPRKKKKKKKKRKKRSSDGEGSKENDTNADSLASDSQVGGVSQTGSASTEGGSYDSDSAIAVQSVATSDTSGMSRSETEAKGNSRTGRGKEKSKGSANEKGSSVSQTPAASSGCAAWWRSLCTCCCPLRAPHDVDSNAANAVAESEGTGTSEDVSDDPSVQAVSTSKSKTDEMELVASIITTPDTSAGGTSEDAVGVGVVDLDAGPTTSSQSEMEQVEVDRVALEFQQRLKGYKKQEEARQTRLDDAYASPKRLDSGYGAYEDDDGDWRRLDAGYGDTPRKAYIELLTAGNGSESKDGENADGSSPARSDGSPTDANRSRWV